MKWDEIVIAIGGPASFVLALGALLAFWFQYRYNKQLGKDNAGLQEQLTTKTAELERITNQQHTKFEKRHEKQSKLAGDTYRRVITLQDLMEKYMSAEMNLSRETGLIEVAERDALWALLLREIKALKNHKKENLIYFGDYTALLIEQCADTIQLALPLRSQQLKSKSMESTVIWIRQWVGKRVDELIANYRKLYGVEDEAEYVEADWKKQLKELENAIKESQTETGTDNKTDSPN